MNLLKHFLFVPLACLLNSAVAQTLPQEGTWIAPSDSNIQYMGRISFQNPDAPAFTYPGVQINVRFEGTSLKMKAKPMSGYFMVSVDGSAPFVWGGWFRAPSA